MAAKSPKQISALPTDDKRGSAIKVVDEGQWTEAREEEQECMFLEKRLIGMLQKIQRLEKEEANPKQIAAKKKTNLKQSTTFSSQKIKPAPKKGTPQPVNRREVTQLIEEEGKLVSSIKELQARCDQHRQSLAKYATLESEIKKVEAENKLLKKRCEAFGYH